MTSKTPALQAEAFLHGLELYRKVVILNRGDILGLPAKGPTSEIF